MNNNTPIDILLATYNGEKYLSGQIDSILSQTYKDWRLIIRDDNSSDNTVRIIESYRFRYPEKITFVKDRFGNLGACHNFAKLLEHSNSKYIMFCDQDDVWLPHKVELTYEKMRHLIGKHGDDIPLLVYTDLQVVDKDLITISNSFWKYVGVSPGIGRSLSRLLLCNVAPGCTMMFNKKLRDLSQPFPSDAIVHDWWLALVSVALGKNDYLSKPTILYRLHSSNTLGQKSNHGMGAVRRKLEDFIKRSQMHKEYLIQTQRQAMAMASKYRQILSIKDLEKISAYANLDSSNFIMKRLCIVKYGFWWDGTTRSLALLLLV